MGKKAVVDGGEDSPDHPTLSQLLELKGGYLSQVEIDTVLAHATILQTSSPITDKDRAWLSDFVLNIGGVLSAERELSGKVVERSTQEPGGSGRPVTNQTTMNTQQPESPQINRPVTMAARPLPMRPTPRIDQEKLVIKPERFDGSKEKAREWLQNFEVAAASNGWLKVDMITYLATYLDKGARDWFSALAQPKINGFTTWDEVRQWFVRYYIGADELRVIRKELQLTRQRREESARNFIARIMKLMIVADPNQSELDRVLDTKAKLKDVYQDKLIGVNPKTIEELNDLCSEIEERLESRREFEQRQSRNKQFQPNRKNNYKNEQSRDQYKNDASRLNNAKGNGSDKSKPKYFCTHCKKDGHSVERCWAKNGKPPSKSDKEQKRVAAMNPQQKEKELTPKVTTVKNVCSVLATIEDSVGIYQAITLNGINYDAMIDTGSRMSVIRAEVAQQLKVIADGSKVNLVGADSQPLTELGMVELELGIRIGDTTKLVTFKFAVVQELCVPVIIGWEAMGWLKLVISPARKLVTFEPEDIIQSPTRDKNTGVRLSEDIIIPAKSEAVVSAIIPESNTTVMTLPFGFTSSVLIANGIDKANDIGEINCVLVNLESNAISINRNTQIAVYEPVCSEKPSKEAEGLAAVMQLPTTEEVITVGDQLSETQVEDLRKLMSRNMEAFSVNGLLGETDLIEHDIELVEGARPVVEPLRRRPYAHKIEAQKQVDKMLQDGVIEHSSSPWGAAYVLVKKKTGEMRLCIDFRKLNDKTKKNVYPLPNIEDCLEPLSGNVYFSQLDLASGYWQIRVAEKARELTAFRTDQGLYQFRRMPFGLCNAPASFSRLMNALLAGLKGVHLQAFIDDICLASTSWEEHLKLIERVFKLLIGANLKLKASKCVFGADKVVFLGHELSASGIKQDPNKVKALTSLPAPKDVKELRRALGLFGYYRRFVPNFAQLAEPLNRLMCKNQPFKWEGEQVEAFERLRKELGSNKVLANFNHTDPLLLKTDASGVGVAAILLQQQNQEWRMITCCSRRLNKCEANYAPSKLEGLAIVYAVSKLRNYLLGKHFTILTDHCALCALKLKTVNCPQLRRWALLLSEFDFSIKYIRGGLHCDVDCLSRAPVDEPIDPYLSDKVLAAMQVVMPVETRSSTKVFPADLSEWKRMVQSDEEAKEHFEKARRRMKGYKIFQGLLYFEDRLFVPQQKRKSLMAEAHADEPGCHGGFRDTVERMSKLWWPAMATDVREYVRSCEVCQFRKAERMLPSGNMYSFETGEPFELIAFDVLGPLPESIHKNKHIFVGIDVFTRFVFAEATADVQAETFICLFKKIIAIVGAPQTLLTDNAPCFSNNLVTNLLERFHVNQRFSTANHHQGNAVVERCIQSLQEKLSLILHDPTASIEWEEALTSAVLSLNTHVNSSTGYAPFELLFGKKHTIRSASVIENNNRHELYAELRERRVVEAHADAVALQFEAQKKSRQHFDSVHRKREFKIGDRVLTKVTGRRSKLQTRFVGPYIVTQRMRDIYTLLGDRGRHETIKRHVSDLIPFVEREKENSSDDEQPTVNQSLTRPLTVNNSVSILLISSAPEKRMNKSVIVILILLVSPTQSYEFVEAPVVSWQQVKTPYVSPGPISYQLLLKFGQPCQMLAQFQVNQSPVNEAEEAVRSCEGVYFQQITQRLLNISSRQTVLGVVKQTITQSSGSSNSNVQQNELPPHPHQFPPTYDPHRTQGYDVGRRPDTMESGPPRGYPPPIGAVQPRQKRGVVDFCVGAFVSNIVSTVADRIWPNPMIANLQDQNHLLEKKLGQLNQNLNFTAQQIAALQESQELTNQLVEHNIQRIDTIIYQWPQLTVVTADIISRMHLIGAFLDLLRVSFQTRTPDLKILSLLLNFDDLLLVDAGSIPAESVKLTTTHDSFLVEFQARKRASDTSVYRVRAFKFWADLLHPIKTQYEYVGPTWVVKNNTSNCIRGIRDPNPSTKFVTVTCDSTNMVDPQLSKWKAIASTTHIKEEAEAQAAEFWPYVYIYCYPGLVNISSVVSKCPPYVFQVNATLSIEARNYSYVPTATQYEEQVTFDVKHIHLRGKDVIIDKLRAVTKINELMDRIYELEKEKTFPGMGEDVTWQRLFYYSISFGGVAACIIVILLIWRGQRLNRALRELEYQRKTRRRNDSRRRLDELYQAPSVAAPTYEEVEMMSRPKRPRIEWRSGRSSA